MSRARRRGGDAVRGVFSADIVDGAAHVADDAQLPAGADQPVPVPWLRLRRRLSDAVLLLLPAPGLLPVAGALPLRRVQARAEPARLVPRPSPGHDPQRLQPAQQPMRRYLIFGQFTGFYWQHS